MFVINLCLNVFKKIYVLFVLLYYVQKYILMNYFMLKIIFLRYKYD